MFFDYIKKKISKTSILDGVVLKPDVMTPVFYDEASQKIIEKPRCFVRVEGEIREMSPQGISYKTGEKVNVKKTVYFKIKSFPSLKMEKKK